MAYGVLTLNFVITFLLTVGILNPIVGIVFTAISILISVVLSDTAAGRLAMVLLIKSRGELSDDIETLGRKVLISAGFIGLALKLAALYGILILAGVTVFLFIAIIVAFGLIINGRLLELIGAFQIAKSIAQIVVFLNSWTDPIINFIIKKEFELLGIETI